MQNSARFLNNNQQEFERPLLGLPRNAGSQQLIQSMGSVRSNVQAQNQMEEERKSQAAPSRKESCAQSSQTSQTEKVSMH